MKLIIGGSRELKITMAQMLKEIERHGLKIDIIICGCAKGPDSVGRELGQEMDICVWQLPAPWNAYKKGAAARMRNRAMGDMADAALLFWDGKSPGTRNMRDIMGEMGKPIYLVRKEAV